MRAGALLAIAAVAVMAWIVLGSRKPAPPPPVSAPPPPSPSPCAVVGAVAGGAYASANGAPPQVGSQGGASAGSLLCQIAPAIWNGLVTAGGAVVHTVEGAAGEVVDLVEGAASDPVGAAGTTLSYGTGLAFVGDALNAIIGDTGHHLDPAADAALKRITTSGIAWTGAYPEKVCALRQNGDNNWVDLSAYCNDARRRAGV